MSEMLTLGVIARKLGLPIHKVEYLIRSRGIKHTGRAGNLRIFESSVIDTLEKEAAKINDRRLIA